MKRHIENADKQKQKTFWIKHVVKPRKVIKVDADELFSGHWISLQCLQASNKTILWYALLWSSNRWNEDSMNRIDYFHTCIYKID